MNNALPWWRNTRRFITFTQHGGLHKCGDGWWWSILDPRGYADVSNCTYPNKKQAHMALRKAIREENMRRNGMSVEEEDAGPDTISLDAPLGNDGETLHDCIPDGGPTTYDIAEYNELFCAMLRAFKMLRQREAYVLYLRFGLGDGYERTREEVGVMFREADITSDLLAVARIRQIEKSGLRKLKHPRCARTLWPFIYPNRTPPKDHSLYK